MIVNCKVTGTETETTHVEVGGSKGVVNLSVFIVVLKLTPSQAMDLGQQLIKVGWDQR